MFTEGAASLPEDGMGVIGKQLASNFDTPGHLMLNTSVTSLSKGQVMASKCRGEDGDDGIDGIDDDDDAGMHTQYKFNCESIVVATDPKSTQTLLGNDYQIPEARSSLCLYFSITGPPPVADPILIINGENSIQADDNFIQDAKPTINNVCFPSAVSSKYAPAGKSLVSVTIVGGVSLCIDELKDNVKMQLKEWFGRMQEIGHS